MTSMNFPATMSPLSRVRAEGPGESRGSGGSAKCIWELMEAIDSYIPEPKRDIDKPFLMPVEDVFSISGRGTVATGSIERGVVQVGDEVEIVGIRADGEDDLYRC